MIHPNGFLAVALLSRSSRTKAGLALKWLMQLQSVAIGEETDLKGHGKRERTRGSAYPPIAVGLLARSRELGLDVECSVGLRPGYQAAGVASPNPPSNFAAVLEQNKRRNAADTVVCSQRLPLLGVEL